MRCWQEQRLGTPPQTLTLPLAASTARRKPSSRSPSRGMPIAMLWQAVARAAATRSTSAAVWASSGPRVAQAQVHAGKNNAGHSVAGSGVATVRVSAAAQASSGARLARTTLLVVPTARRLLPIMLTLRALATVMPRLLAAARSTATRFTSVVLCAASAKIWTSSGARPARTTPDKLSLVAASPLVVTAVWTSLSARPARTTLDTPPLVPVAPISETQAANQVDTLQQEDVRAEHRVRQARHKSRRNVQKL